MGHSRPNCLALDAVVRNGLRNVANAGLEMLGVAWLNADGANRAQVQKLCHGNRLKAKIGSFDRKMEI